jgi:hypothetical protein
MKHAAFKASYADWKLVKTRACVQIIFEVPVEKANEAYEVLGGMPFCATEKWFAIARLNESAVVADAPAANLSPSHAPAAGAINRLTKRAGILASSPLFLKWLREERHMLIGTEDDAANYIRTTCGVKTRKDILPGTEAAIRLDLLESAFICWRDKDAFVEP